MTKTELFMGCLLLLSTQESALHAQDKPNPSPRALIDESVSKARSASTTQEASAQLELLEVNLIKLGEQGSLPDVDARRRLTLEAIALARSTGGDEAADTLRSNAVELVAQFGEDSKSARAFIVQSIETGSYWQRKGAMNGIRSAFSFMSKDERWDLVQRLFEQGKITEDERIWILTVLSPDRLQPVLTRQVLEAKTKEDLIRYGRHIQGKRNLPLILGKAQQFTLKSNSDPSKDELEWIENWALAACLQEEQGKSLLLCLEYANRRPCSVRFCLDPILARNLLDDSNSEIRESVADYIGARARAMSIQPPDKVRPLLTERLAIESDPKVRRAIDTAIQKVDRGIVKWKRLQEREGQR